MLARARESYGDLVERVTDTRPEPEALGELGAYGMAATLDIAPAAKQALLEVRSEPPGSRSCGGCSLRLLSASARRVSPSRRAETDI